MARWCWENTVLGTRDGLLDQVWGNGASLARVLPKGRREAEVAVLDRSVQTCLGTKLFVGQGRPMDAGWLAGCGWGRSGKA
jgi:hypothetical protein